MVFWWWYEPVRYGTRGSRYSVLMPNELVVGTLIIRALSIKNHFASKAPFVEIVPLSTELDSDLCSPKPLVVTMNSRAVNHHLHHAFDGKQTLFA